jgi:hypothetical protein
MQPIAQIDRIFKFIKVDVLKDLKIETTDKAVR